MVFTRRDALRSKETPQKKPCAGITGRFNCTAVCLVQQGNQGRLVELDIRPAMLAVARSIAAPGGPPIEWHEGNAVEHHLPSSAFGADSTRTRGIPIRCLALRHGAAAPCRLPRSLASA
jgi:hypothetical protein